MRNFRDRRGGREPPAATRGAPGATPVVDDPGGDDTVTADPFAAAAGLVSRSAAAYASSIPQHPADDGFFGPGSVAWRVSADLSSPVAGLRALHLQALHPLAMAGVDQHSDWRQDPVGRLGAPAALPAPGALGGRGAGPRGG